MEQSFPLKYNEVKQNYPGLSLETNFVYTFNIQNDVQKELECWKEKNNRETEKFCTELLQKLEQEYFDPILVRLELKTSDLTATDIMQVNDSIHQDYWAEARGIKSVRAQVFTDFHPVRINNMMLAVDIVIRPSFVVFRKLKVNSKIINHAKHNFLCYWETISFTYM